jgi:cytoskeletal protein RodZ
MWSKLVDLVPGLGQIKLSVTTVIGIAIAVFIAGLIAMLAWQDHQIKSLNTAAGQATQQISDLKQTNADLQKQLDAQQKSGKVNDTVTTQDVQQKQDATTATNAIATKTDSTVTTIIKKYQPQGPTQVITPAQQTQMSHDLDEANIDGAWQTFCAAAPNEKACAQVPAKAAPAKAASVPTAQVGPMASNN